MLRFFFILMFGAMFFISCESDQPKQAVIEDLEKELPGQIKILFQNDFVMVTRLTLKPGDALPLHRENNRILLAKNDCELEIVEGGKKAIRKKFAKEEFAWYDAMIHSVRNPGGADIELYVVTRKKTPLPAYSKSQLKKNKPANFSVLFENDQAIINEVFLGAGRKSTSQSGYYRLIYAKSEYQMENTDSAGTSETVLYPVAKFYWLTPEQLHQKNVGDTDARYLMVEFLK